MKLGGHVKPLATMLGVIFASNHAGGKIPTSVYHVNGISQAYFANWFLACVKIKPIFELIKNSKMVLSLLFIFHALVNMKSGLILLYCFFVLWI